MHPALRSAFSKGAFLFTLISGGCQKNDYADTGAPALAVELDAGVAAANERLVVTVRHQLPDGGMELVEFDGGAPPEIEPTRLLELTTNFSIHNYRIRIFDELDRALVSDDLATDRDNLRYQIRLRQPLEPGHRYTMLLDAQTGESILGPQGRPEAEQRLEFQVAGPREKAALPPKVKKRKRRRHTQRLHREPPVAGKPGRQTRVTARWP